MGIKVSSRSQLIGESANDGWTGKPRESPRPLGSRLLRVPFTFAVQFAE